MDPSNEFHRKVKFLHSSFSFLSFFSSSLNNLFQDSLNPFFSQIKDRIEELVLITTQATNLASRLALLDLLQCLEEGTQLPALDQSYFQRLLSVIDHKTREFHGHAQNLEQREHLRSLFDLLPHALTTPPAATPNQFPPTTFNNSKNLANRVALQLATMTRNAIVSRFSKLQRRKLRDRLRSQFTPKEIDGREMVDLLDDLQAVLK